MILVQAEFKTNMIYGKYYIYIFQSCAEKLARTRFRSVNRLLLYVGDSRTKLSHAFY